MSICTLFCFWGVFALSHAREHLERIRAPSSSEDSQAKPIQAFANTQVNHKALVLLGVVFLLRAVVLSTAQVLWPLVVADRLLWTSHEYAYLLFASSITSTLAVTGYPYLEQKIGGLNTASWALILASLACLIGFGQHTGDTSIDAVLHIGFSIILFSCLALLEPCLLASAALHMPAEKGRSFGVAASVTRVGEIIGQLSGTYLYSSSKAWDPQVFGAMGHLPFLLTTGILGIAICLIVWLKYSVSPSSMNLKSLNGTIGNPRISKDVYSHVKFSPLTFKETVSIDIDQE